MLAGLAVVAAFALSVRSELRRRARNSLGRGRLATVKDARGAGMLETSGPYLGTLDGRPLHFNGDGHLLTYGRAGSGKGATVILPNLATLQGRSLVVTDPKGENERASAWHRKNRLGSKVIFINPWRVDGLPTVRINPLSRLNALSVDRVADIEAKAVAEMIVPKPSNVGDNEWVYMGAQSMIALRLRFMAHARPDDNTLGNLLAFINQPFKAFANECLVMDKSGLPGVQGAAAKLAEYGDQNPKSFESISSMAINRLDLYARGGVLDEATAASD
ncbi:MAG TPA: type IV secretory system conjugative DNA transfer family protein, partial [Rhabdaerophilum sp.]|nr:type IV secretory system conjugative DNA transfer family protein [Rhabdaerophilum sp.]